MSRFSHLGAVFFLALSSVLVSAPLAAQKGASAQHDEVQRVLVHGTGSAMEIEIQTSSASVSPDTQAITGPDRIVVDFPGMLPSAELRALKVNQGALKAIRSGLFFSNPPITRIVLDLSEPQSYRISTARNSIIVKLGPAAATENQETSLATAGSAHLQNASLTAAPLAPTPAPRIAAATVSAQTPSTAIVPSAGVVTADVVSAKTQDAASVPVAAPLQPVLPPVKVSYENGLLSIHAEKATLAEVLFEVQQQTQADIAIPAGAEQERVIADLGPGPARDVLSELLNGSSYNFVFVGNELTLERVILTRRDSAQ
ncbi:MAG: AMIN domain-containing protein [Terriglobales bacterium]|jgi:hypothetical protein